jgi:hypothetical protein
MIKFYTVLILYYLLRSRSWQSPSCLSYKPDSAISRHNESDSESGLMDLFVYQEVDPAGNIGETESLGTL